RLLRAKAAAGRDEITADLNATARDKLAALEILTAASQAPRAGYASSPFVALERTDLFPDEQDALIDALTSTASALDGLGRSAMELARCTLAPPPANVAAIGEYAKSALALPDLPVTMDRGLLRRAATQEGRDELASLERLLQRREGAQVVLQRAGIIDPDHLAAGCLGEFARRTASLGLSHVRVDDIASRARSASAELHDCSGHGGTVVSLAALLGVPPNPDRAALASAAAAARLAAEADADWLGYRRAGLAKQAVALSELAVEADRVAGEERRIAAHLTIEGGSPAEFCTAAQALRSARALGFLSAEIRKARRFLADRRRGGRPAGRDASDAELLNAAAALIEARESLRTNPLVVSLFGPEAKLDPVALRHASLAAAWQQRVEELAKATAGKGATIAERLVELGPSSISQLGTLAPAAGDLERWLRNNGFDPATRWADLRHELAERARVLAMLAIEIAEVGLAPETPLSALADLEHAHTEWRNACDGLAAHPELSGFGKPPLRAGLIAEALKFAVDAAVAFREGAGCLLAEGWPDEHVDLLRSAADVVSGDLARLREATEPLNSLGLPSLVREIAEGRPQEALAAVRRLLEGREALPNFLRYAKGRQECLDDRLAAVV
ncbi:MAG: hypothetical protein ACREFP_15875, partial [Acetobacteraceae bacterium]